MFSVKHTIYINRPPEPVFDIFALPEGRMKWSGSDSAWVTPEPHGVGSRSRTVAKLLGREMEVATTILEWQPPFHLVTHSDGTASATMTTRLKNEMAAPRCRFTAMST